MKQRKTVYVAPCLEVVPLETEGVIADSGSSIPEVKGTEITNTPSSSVLVTDPGLEEMINDLFTIEE